MRKWKSICTHTKYNSFRSTGNCFQSAVGSKKSAAQHFLMVHMVGQCDQCAHGPPSQYYTSPNQCNGGWVLIGTSVGGGWVMECNCLSAEASEMFNESSLMLTAWSFNRLVKKCFSTTKRSRWRVPGCTERCVFAGTSVWPEHHLMIVGN